MKVEAIKTKIVGINESTIIELLDNSISTLKNKSVVLITSKIVSLCEGRVVKKSEIDKKELIERESDKFIPGELNRYGVTISIKDGYLMPSAGIDDSNINDEYYVLWPRDPYITADTMRKYLEQKFGLEEIAVIITDSTVNMLEWGTTGIGIAFSGLEPINDYRGKDDLFGNELKVSTANVVRGLATSAVLVMGEGDEQTPIAIIEDVPFVKFTKRDTTKEDIEVLKTSPEEDLFENILDNKNWKDA